MQKIIKVKRLQKGMSVYRLYTADNHYYVVNIDTKQILGKLKGFDYYDVNDLTTREQLLAKAILIHDIQERPDG